MATSKVTAHAGTALPEELVEILDAYGQTAGEYKAAAYALRSLIEGTGLEAQLRQLHDDGPTWDGNLISKADRKQLVRWGLAEKVYVDGSGGYQACTYRGHDVLTAGERE